MHTWTCMDMYGHAWTFMDMHEHVWTCMDMHGHVCMLTFITAADWIVLVTKLSFHQSCPY